MLVFSSLLACSSQWTMTLPPWARRASRGSPSLGGDVHSCTYLDPLRQHLYDAFIEHTVRQGIYYAVQVPQACWSRRGILPTALGLSTMDLHQARQEVRDGVCQRPLMDL